MSSCCGFRKRIRLDDEEGLLAEYRDETSLQRTLHQKLHSYQMTRALAAGYMPSTEQLVINLRTLIASDVLNPDNPELSDSGRHLTRYSKQWLKEFIDLLQQKNAKDQIQDFVWFLTKARISLDVDRVKHSSSRSRVKADATAGMNTCSFVVMS